MMTTRRSRKETRQIRRGLEDDFVRTFVRVIGILRDLPSDRSRERVLRFVDDHFAENDPQYVSVFHD